MLTTVLKLGPEMTGIVEEIQRILAGIQYHYVSFDVLTGISCIVPIVLCCEAALLPMPKADHAECDGP
jgi:hypothetical protein